jgi:hypothetical protein
MTLRQRNCIAGNTSNSGGLQSVVEPGLLFSTSLVNATWTSELHLNATRDFALQMGSCNVGERSDEGRGIVERFSALDIHAQLDTISLQVDLRQSLDVPLYLP